MDKAARTLYKSLLRRAREFDRDACLTAFMMRSTKNHRYMWYNPAHPWPNLQDEIVQKLANGVREVRTKKESDFMLEKAYLTLKTLNNVRCIVNGMFKKGSGPKGTFVFNSVEIDGQRTIEFQEEKPEREQVCNALVAIDHTKVIATMLWTIPASHFPQKGVFLLAHPLQYMKGLQHTVIFIVHHDMEKSQGVMINNVNCNKLAATLTASVGSELFQDRTSFGGHNSDMVLLHSFDNITASVEVIPGVYSGGDLQQLSLRCPDELQRGLKFYYGVSCWSPGQLEAEIRQGAWFVAHASPNFIFHTLSAAPSANKHVQIWSDMLQLMGGKFSQIAKAPIVSQSDYVALLNEVFPL